MSSSAGLEHAAIGEARARWRDRVRRPHPGLRTETGLDRGENSSSSFRRAASQPVISSTENAIFEQTSPKILQKHFQELSSRIRALSRRAAQKEAEQKEQIRKAAALVPQQPEVVASPPMQAPPPVPVAPAPAKTAAQAGAQPAPAVAAASANLQQQPSTSAAGTEDGSSWAFAQLHGYFMPSWEAFQSRKKALDTMEKSFQEVLARKETDSQVKGIFDSVRRSQRRALNSIAASKRKARDCGSSLSLSLQEFQQHALVYPFALVQLANEFMTQAIDYGGKNMTNAFALGHCFAVVAAAHPHLLQATLAKLNMACPFTIPYYPSRDVALRNVQNKEQQTAMLKEACGYLKRSASVRAEDPNNQDPFESIDDYTRRMRGFLQFFAAVISEMDPSLGYSWFSAILSLRQPIKYTSLCYDVVLTMAGPSLCRAFPRQFPKMLFFLRTKVMPLLRASKCPDAEISRIESILSIAEARKGIPDSSEYVEFASD